MSAREYKKFKGLKKENLRDNMTNKELVLNMLAEISTKEISENTKYKWGMGIVDEKNLQYGCLDNRTDWRDFISG